MKTFIIQWNYRSSLGGPWTKGQAVQLDPVLANAINIDSPGVLVEKPAEPVEMQFPHMDRMVKKSKRRGGSNE